MVNPITTPLLLLILHLAFPPAAHAVLNVWVHNCSTVDGNYATTSTYKTNLDSLFSKTTTTNLNSGFYNFSAGQSPDTANLISLCLGNIDVTGCHTCQKFVINNITSLCPDQKTAIAWSDDCFVRYSSESIFGVLAEEPSFLMLRGVKATDDIFQEYSNKVTKLLKGLPSKASAGDSSIKFAADQVEFNSSLTIFAAAQCTPDLAQKDCLNCLNVAKDQIESCKDCPGQRGARVLLPSCSLRFEENKFYLSSDAPVPSTSTSPSPAGSTTTSAVAPSGNSTANAPKKNRIGSRSSIVAIAVVGACFSALL